MDEWISAIRDSTARLYNELANPIKEKEKDSKEKDKDNKEDQKHTASSWTTTETAFPETSISPTPNSALISSTASVEKESDEEVDPRTILAEFIQNEEAGNNVCADCQSPDPRWASINLGIMVCIECSGIHRSLGVHISQVRSVDLDRWTLDTAQFMQTTGNKKSNEIWEYDVPETCKKPCPTDPRSIKEDWIHQKYLMKRFANPNIIPKDTIAVTKVLNFDKEGFLTKQGNSVKSWKRRWFVLKVTKKTAFMFYYRARGDSVAAGAIDLAFSHARLSSKPNAFEIITPSRAYTIIADTPVEMNAWLTKLKEAIDVFNKRNNNNNNNNNNTQQ